MFLSLQHRYQLKLSGIEYGPAMAAMLASASNIYLTPALLPTLMWAHASEPWLDKYVMPKLVPDTVCPGCKKRLSLTGKWKCKDHYTDYRECHILHFHCSQGHMLKEFDCPDCGTTIIVRKRYGQRYRKGKALELEVLDQPSDGSPTSGIVIGQNQDGNTLRLPIDDIGKHVFIVGKSGSGKTETVKTIALPLIDMGYGLSQLDLGGDLTYELEQLIPDERRAQLDLRTLKNNHNQIAINLLEHRSEQERGMVVKDVGDMFAALFGLVA